MGKADLHMHTRHSDGQPTVRELLDHVRDFASLDVIAITDHDTISGALEARTMARDYPFDVIVGEEVTSRDGHVVGLFLDDCVPPGMSVEDTVQAIHAQGGLAFAPHPFFKNGYFSNKGYTMIGLGDRLLDSCIDGIETANSTPALARANERAERFSKTAGVFAEFGNSDAHIKQAIGKSFTLFPGQYAEDLRKAIPARQTRPGRDSYSVGELLTYLNFWLRVMKLGVPAGRKYCPGAPADLPLIPTLLAAQGAENGSQHAPEGARKAHVA